jgi:2-polyprenyl-6-methoxyphenol hydroxylase-like FAD-dependent oxidoreductase
MGYSGKPEVVIVGAGPGGMLLAYLLVTNGIAVHVLERHPDFKREFRGEGIQPSVMQTLDELGFLPQLVKRGIAVSAHQAQIFLDGRPVATLDGSEAEAGDFGLIVFQEGFLEFLHQQCSQYEHYRLDMGVTVTGIVADDGRVVAVKTRARDGKESSVEGDFFITAAGRGTGLRGQAGLTAEVFESSFDIYWMKFDPAGLPGGSALVPDGFHAYLQDESMFIFYRTYDQRIQVAWGKRGWNAAGLRDLSSLRAQLLRESPPAFRELIAQQFSEKTERQLLKVACDRLDAWHVPGMLFLGDAAHTMSPVAGQGINLAIRDGIVAANHMIRTLAEGRTWDSAMCQAIEDERRPEIEAMQTFQVRLGYLMLGAPRLQRRLFFRYGLPLLSLLGLRRRFVRQVQRGVTDLRVEYPVPPRVVAG